MKRRQLLLGTLKVFAALPVASFAGVVQRGELKETVEHFYGESPSVLWKADEVLMAEYRKEFLAGFEQHQSLLKDVTKDT